MPVSTNSLNEDINLIVKVRLLSKSDDSEITGTQYTVRLYDKDIFNDDFLGESSPDHEGVVRISFTRKDFAGSLLPEEKPDFYFVVYKDGVDVFKSKVMSNIDLSDVKEFVMKEGEIIDLGTYLINV